MTSTMRAVVLDAPGPAEALEHYRRGAPTHDDMETELRAIFGRTEEEPLPDLSLFPKELMEYESPPGTYFDAFPLLLLSEAALEHLRAKAVDSIIDVRRFRPNFLIHTEGDGEHPELAWRSRRLKIGEVTVDVTLECPRCVMTTHGFADLPKDPSVMRTLVRETGGNLGVYATVAKPGYVGVGDSVEMLV